MRSARNGGAWEGVSEAVGRPVDAHLPYAARNGTTLVAVSA